MGCVMMFLDTPHPPTGGYNRQSAGGGFMPIAALESNTSWDAAERFFYAPRKDARATGLRFRAVVVDCRESLITQRGVLV